MKKITLIILSFISFNTWAIQLSPVDPASVKAPVPTLQAVPVNSVKTPVFSLTAVDPTKVNVILPKLKNVEPKDVKSGDPKLGLEPAHKDVESVSKAERGSWRFNPWR